MTATPGNPPSVPTADADRAPSEQIRCTVCGGGGPKTNKVFRGWMMCRRCRLGAIELIKDGWGFDEHTGSLIDPTGYTQAYQDQRSAAVRDLYAVLNRELAKEKVAQQPITIEIFNTLGGVALITPVGRVHVFPPGHGTFPTARPGDYTAALFTPAYKVLGYTNLGPQHTPGVPDVKVIEALRTVLDHLALTGEQDPR